MEKQSFTLPKYGWRVTVFYNTTPRDVGYVVDALEDLNCPLESIERSYRNIVDGGVNNGMTYSNVKFRESIVSIGHTDSLAQFLNSFQHEITHLCRHICEYFGIDPWGEEAAYLAGAIAQKMHHCLEPYMCDCKRGCCH